MNKHLETWIDGGSGVPDPTRCFAVIIAAGLAGIALLVLAIVGCVSVLGCSHLGTIVDAIPTNAVEHVTTTTTTTTTTTQPEPVSAYKITRVTASMIYWTGPNMPDSWKDRRAEEVRNVDDRAMIERAGGPCCGEVHLKSSKGKAKFDHLRRDTKSRDWVNIHGGYGSWKQWGEPADGEDCELWAHPYSNAEGEPIKIGGFKWVR